MSNQEENSSQNDNFEFTEEAPVDAQEEAQEMVNNAESDFINDQNIIMNEGEAIGILTDGHDGDTDDLVIVVFDDDRSLIDETPPNDDSRTISEADLFSIKNIIEEKRLQRENLQLQGSFDDADNSSQPSTPASFADKNGNSALLRRARGRRKRPSPDRNVGKKFIFPRSVAKRVGQRCLRRLLKCDDDDDRSSEGDHYFSNFRSRKDSPTFTDEKTIETETNDTNRNQSTDYYRAIFLSENDDGLRPSPTDDPTATDDVNVDDSGLHKENSFVKSEPEEQEMDEALSSYLQTKLWAFRDLYDEAQQIATSVGEIFGPVVHESNEWKKRLLRHSETPPQTKLIESVSKVLDGIYFSTLVAAGSSDEWTMCSQSMKHSATLLRQSFAYGISSGGLSILVWLHWLLMKCLPPETAAWYLLILRELYHKTPETVMAIVNLDHETDKRAIELVSGFLVGPKVPNISSELFFHQQPPPRLPKDPILMLVSSTIKAHSDMLARGNPRCHYFYKHLFPRFGFCVDVKFTPFKKAMTMSSCADQLCAFLRDKIREVRFFHGNRPIIMIGWQTSGLVALKIALEKNVAAVVCLGFPNLTLSGMRGENGDELLEVKCPTLFVVGQFASACSISDLAEMKTKIKSERTGLIVVGGADDELKMNINKLRSENLSQEIVDRCILESVGEFLCPALEAYVDTAEDGSFLAGSGIGITPPLPKRRRNTIGIGQLSEKLLAPQIDFRSKAAKVSTKSSSRSKSKTSVDNSAKEKTASAVIPSTETVSSSKVGEDTSTNTSTDDNHTNIVGMGSTRTRQIRKPMVLDL